MGLTANIGLPGAQNNSGDSRALFLKVFSGEVIQQFRVANVMQGRVITRTIPYGKSAQFPVMGRAYAIVHTPGVNILDSTNQGVTSLDPASGGTVRALTNKIPHNERLIYVDNKLIASEMVSDIDELLNHYDVRSRYADEFAQALATAYDKSSILALVVAARIRSNNSALLSANNGYPAEPGGGTNGDGGSIGVGSTPTGQTITDALFQAAQRFDELSIPRAGRAVVLTPAAFWALIKDPTLYLVSAPSNAAATFTAATKAAVAATTPAASGAASFSNPNLMFGNASWANGTITSIAGFEILMSNNVPTLDFTTGSGASFFSGLASASNGNSYAIDCSSARATAGQTQGVVFHSSAIGALRIRDISSEMQWYPEYQGTLMLSKYLAGFSWLRPSAAIELTSVTKSSGA